MNMSVPRISTPMGRRGNKGCVYGRSLSDSPRATYAMRKRREISPMLVQTSSAEMPVMFSSQVNTMPSPQMVVRNVRHEKASASLREWSVSIGIGE